MISAQWTFGMADLRNSGSVPFFVRCWDTSPLRCSSGQTAICRVQTKVVVRSLKYNSVLSAQLLLIGTKSLQSTVCERCATTLPQDWTRNLS